MKRFLTLSLLFNLALLLVLWGRNSHSSPMPRQPRSEVGRPASRSLKRLRKADGTTPAPATPWQAIESTDTARFIANLRALGCPEQTIQDIVVLRVCSAYRSRVMQVEAEFAGKWDYTHERRDWREVGDQRTALRNEMISSLESAFDKSWNSITSSMLGWPDREDHGLDFLTIEKRKQLRELDQRYSDLMGDLDGKRQSGTLAPEDRARFQELNRQKWSELDSILPAQQVEEYFYRQSPSAYYVRQNLPPATSEEEFRKMVKVAEDMGVSGWRNPPNKEESDEDESVHEARLLIAALQQRLKEVLGEDRIALQEAEALVRAEEEKKQQAERSDQSMRAEIASYAEEAGVPAQDAQKFFDRLQQSQAELTAKFGELEKSLTGTPEEKDEKMKAIIKPVLEQMAVETMGEKGRLLVQIMIQHHL
jgi:hypothetical protein